MSADRIYDEPRGLPVRPGLGEAGTPRIACNRPDLADWSVRGGPLPARLASHVNTCPACADRVRRVNEVHASFTLLRTQSASPNLLARANGRALRMLRRAARASAAAERLLRMHPQLSTWQRAQVHMARMSLGAAAAVLVLCARMGILAGFEQTRQMGEQLAATHWERHIDPGGQFLGPRDLA
jgi:hypothetical protein